MAEVGVYAQGFTYGIAAGWDTTEGFTLSGFQSVSAGVSADVWTCRGIVPLL